MQSSAKTQDITQTESNELFYVLQKRAKTQSHLEAAGNW